jgi:hypothetical protein
MQEWTNHKTKKCEELEQPEFQNEEEEIVLKTQEQQADEETQDTPAEKDPTNYTTRSGRLSRPTPYMNLYQAAEQHLSHDAAQVEEYTSDTA